MRKSIVILALSISVLLVLSFMPATTERDLRTVYSASPEKWPQPFIDAGVVWEELGPLPAAPQVSNQRLVTLGKLLFFDPRLSGSGLLSCASCHKPELSWTDGLERSLGHEGQLNKRNSPSLQNVWFYKKLFWDGRSKDLEDQAFAPINSESEMHGDIRALPISLKKIAAYPVLFDSAFGDPSIDPDRIAAALAAFQRTIISRQSRFDRFLAGDKKALTDQELSGLHLFRTKARCMNCHNGPLFSDNSFHNNGFANADRGLYQVSHDSADWGKMKTPSLRDVMRTRPWMHDGSVNDMNRLIDRYSSGNKGEHTDPLLRELQLSGKEKADLRAFLLAISSAPLGFQRPVLP